MSQDTAIGRRLSVLTDTFRTQLWPMPSLAIVVAIALGVVLPLVDGNIDAGLPNGVHAYLFSGGADAARAVLSAVAGSLVMMTSLTFSLTVVTLQLASGQFSPRLLRTFTSDRFVHGTLALFLATFVYTLTVLRSVRTNTAGQSEFVPQISLTLAFVLALASVMGLVLFLAHLTREIRVETMLKRVHAEAEGTVRRMVPERDPESRPVELPEVPPYAVRLLAEASGFVTALDEGRMLAAAVEADAVVLVERAPGASLVVGTPFGFAWPRSGTTLEPEAADQLRRQVVRAVRLRYEDTAAQNVSYGLRQLTDVVNRALSTGINDPTTAVHALAHSSALLCDLATRDLGPSVRRDDDGVTRVVSVLPGLNDLLDLAMGGPRHYGASDPDVVARLFVLLRELAWSTDQPAHHAAVRDQLERLAATAEAQDFDATDRERLRHLGLRVEEALRGEWRPDHQGD